jgi:glutathione reductase (NADPH)
MTTTSSSSAADRGAFALPAVSAAHGARVGLAEEYRVGGTCVIRGCVPKKLLVYGAHFAEDLADARRFGWDVPKCDFNWPTLRDNVLAEVDRIETVYGGILENNKVDLHHQRATVTGPNQVTLADGTAVHGRHHSRRHRLLALRARHSRRRARHHVQRGVPPRRNPEAGR